MQSTVILLDLSEFFDTINRGVLLNHLRRLGVGGTLARRALYSFMLWASCVCSYIKGAVLRVTHALVT